MTTREVDAARGNRAAGPSEERSRPIRADRLRRIPLDDIGRYLGFLGWMPWLLYGSYVGLFGFLALAYGGAPAHSPIGIAALASLVAAGALLATPSVTPLPWWRTVAVLAVVAFSVMAITWQQPFHDQPPGHMAWELAANNTLLFCLTVRGRILAAWVGELVSIGLIALWSTAVTGGPWYGIGFSYTQMTTLLGCTVFAIGLHRTAQAVAAHRAAERARVSDEARREVTDDTTRAELQLVRTLAEPTLRAIAVGAAPDRRAAESLEAALRDFIRARRLAAEPLVGALRLAREGGADVVVLDDYGEGPLDRHQLEQIVAWGAVRVEEQPGPRMTLRLERDADGPLATFAGGAGTVAEFRPASGSAEHAFIRREAG